MFNATGDLMNLDDVVVLMDQDFHDADIAFSRHTRIATAERTRFSHCRLTLDPQGMPAARDNARLHIRQSTLEDCTITATGRCAH